MKGTQGDERGVRVRALTTLQEAGEVARLLQAFERVVEEQGWQPEGQMRAYAGHSVYFGAYVGDELAGGLHLVLGGTARLPVLTVWPELCLQGRTDIADVALVALLPAYRARHDLLWRLFLTMWRWCTDHGIQELWSEIPVSRLRLYNRLGWNLQIAGPSRPHWGEECYPCRVGVQELADSFAERARTSAFYQQLFAQAHEKPAERLVFAAEQEGGNT